MTKCKIKIERLPKDSSDWNGRKVKIRKRPYVLSVNPRDVPEHMKSQQESLIEAARDYLGRTGDDYLELTLETR